MAKNISIAIQYNGANFGEISRFILVNENGVGGCDITFINDEFTVLTNNGYEVVNIGDWVVIGNKGVEIYKDECWLNMSYFAKCRAIPDWCLDNIRKEKLKC